MVTKAESRLSFLLGIEQSEIDADLARYYGRVAELIEEIRQLLHRPRAERGVEVEAKVAHLRMIQAHEFCVDATLPPEVKTFYAALGAEAIAQDAGFAAAEKGAVAELARQMQEIREREAQPCEETWGRGEGPQDYQELAGRHAELLQNIEQTMIVFLLRRYRLDDQADLYEKDRATFEIQREIGRILMMESGSPPAEQELLNGYLGKNYGQGAVQRVLSRLREIRGGV